MSADWINGRPNSPHTAMTQFQQKRNTTGSSPKSLVLRLQSLTTEKIKAHKLTYELSYHVCGLDQWNHNLGPSVLPPKHEHIIPDPQSE
jgi:hypothetical protein